MLVVMGQAYSRARGSYCVPGKVGSVSKHADVDKGDSPLRLVEKKGFTQARCDCGWEGAGRRSRKKARGDAAAHAEKGCKATKNK